MRKFLKLILLWVSSVLYHNKKSKIIFYHDVYKDIHYKDRDTGIDMGTSIDLFKQHLKVIRESGFVITERVTKRDGEIMICFDDGFRGIFDNREFFIREGIKPVVFLATSLIGCPGYLNREEILELQNIGFIFQCHAFSHKDLTSFSKDELKRELYDSKNLLQELLGKDVNEICFPIGFFSQMVLDECKRNGYNVMYSSIPGNFYDINLSEGVKARNLVQFSTPRELKMILRGGYEMIKQRYVNMHWRG